MISSLCVFLLLLYVCVSITHFRYYCSQTCIKRSPLEQRKSGLTKQV